MKWNEEVEDEMEPRRRPAEQMVCGCWIVIVHYDLNTANNNEFGLIVYIDYTPRFGFKLVFLNVSTLLAVFP